MKNILLSPPVVFIILLAVSFLFSALFRIFAFTGKESPGKTKSYSCGEDVAINKVQTDYSQFFPFAFFFTIMHVVVLMVATIPLGFSVMPVVYIVAAVMALSILFRR